MCVFFIFFTPTIPPLHPSTIPHKKSQSTHAIASTGG